jgi:hypothetical protein
MSLWLKALIVHTAEWPTEAHQILESVMKVTAGTQFRDEACGVLGYGVVRPERATACAPERVTLLGAGVLGREETATHRVPIPPGLHALALWRRLTITLAWYSPINPQHRKYRVAALQFSIPGAATDVLMARRMQADGKATGRGCVQHEVLEGNRDAMDVVAGATIEIPVTCRADAGELVEQVPYALAVTLEVAPGLNVPIYDEVRAALRVPVGVRG